MKRLLFVLPVILIACSQTPTTPQPEPPLPQTEMPAPTDPANTQANGCVRAGCSNQLCVEASEAADIMTTCEFRDEYACLEHSVCERQANGECGWSETDAYLSCMSNIEINTTL